MTFSPGMARALLATLTSGTDDARKRSLKLHVGP
jgi:hypothetical protein